MRGSCWVAPGLEVRVGLTIYCPVVSMGGKPVDITPLTRNPFGDFAGEVTGIDLTRPLGAATGGGDRGRHGPLRRAGLPRPAFRRRHPAGVQPEFRRAGDFLRRRDEQAGGPAAEDRDGRYLQPRSQQQVCAQPTTGCAWARWATGCGIPTRRSGRFRRNIRCCRRGLCRAQAAIPNLPTCARPMTRSDDATKAEIEDLVTEHSNAYSRELIGFPQEAYGGGQPGQAAAGAPPPGAHASGDRAEVAVSVRPYRRPSSAGRCRRRGRSSAT